MAVSFKNQGLRIRSVKITHLYNSVFAKCKISERTQHTVT